MRWIKKSIIYFASLPINLFIAWPMVLIVRLLWGKNLEFSNGVLSCEFKYGSWPLGGRVNITTKKPLKSWPVWWPKGFYLVNRKAVMGGYAVPLPWAGTSLGHGHIYGPGMKSTMSNRQSITEIHELIHTRQAELYQLASAVIAHLVLLVELLQGDIVTAFVLYGCIWTFGGYILQTFLGFLLSWLHGGSPYYGSINERSARAISIYVSKLEDLND